MLRRVVSEHPEDPLPAYLLGRRAESAGLATEADRALAGSLAAGLAPRPLAFEATRIRAMLAFQGGRLDDAAALFQDAAGLSAALGQSLEMKDWQARCDFLKRRAATPDKTE